MINERKLISAIKEAYRTGGYHVTIDGTQLRLRGSEWGLSIHTSIVPSKVLSLLVEHIGAIPDDDCYFCAKGQDAQIETSTVNMAPVIEAVRQASGRATNALPTPLELGGYRVWQQLGDLLCFTADQSYTDIAEPDAVSAWIRDADQLYARMQNAVLVVEVLHDGNESPELAHLGQMQWRREA